MQSQSVQTKLSLISFLGMFLMGAVMMVLYSNSWKNLSKAYALVSLNQRLGLVKSNSLNIAQYLENGEWAVEMSKSNLDASTRWIQNPVGIPDSDLKSAVEKIAGGIQKTGLEAGSTEISLGSNDSDQYYVAFNENPSSIVAIGSNSYRKLSGWRETTIPFLGSLSLAFLVTALALLFYSRKLAKVYSSFSNLVLDVSAGRLSDLKFPHDGEQELRKLGDALARMVELLRMKEEKISETSQLALLDPMTGLPNYRAFQNEIKNVLLAYSKNEKQGKVVLGIVDLDFFKKFNDTYGHLAGDYVLKQTAKSIHGAIRTAPRPSDGHTLVGDFCARYGGEEFVVIFKNVKPGHEHDGVLRVLRQICGLEITFPAEAGADVQGKIVKLTASIGFSVWDPEKHVVSDALIKDADDALYIAKHNGRARVCSQFPEKKVWLP